APDAVVGTPACPDKASSLTNALLSTDSGQQVRALLDQVAQKLKAGEPAPEMGNLVLRIGDDTLKSVGVLGEGAYGVVYQFSSVAMVDHNKVAAVKILLETESPLLPDTIPNELKCRVVRTAHFFGGLVQVMEMGNTDPSTMDPTAALVKDFDDFSNDTALCLLGSGLVCTDWKLPNLTYFTGECAGFRVIDVDGITFPAVPNYYYVITFSCTSVPSLPAEPSPEEIAHRACCTFISTAYAIELGKCMFRYGLYRNDHAIDMLAELGQRDPRPLADAATVDLTREKLEKESDIYAPVCELLRRLSGLDVQARCDRTAVDRAKAILVKWFSDDGGPDAKRSRVA
ncbi:MAG: hypothetical protein ACPGR8_17355, partial [Limisphaerales bacterium]